MQCSLSSVNRLCTAMHIPYIKPRRMLIYVAVLLLFATGSPEFSRHFTGLLHEPDVYYN